MRLLQETSWPLTRGSEPVDRSCKLPLALSDLFVAGNVNGVRCPCVFLSTRFLTLLCFRVVTRPVFVEHVYGRANQSALHSTTPADSFRG